MWVKDFVGACHRDQELGTFEACIRKLLEVHGGNLGMVGLDGNPYGEVADTCSLVFLGMVDDIQEVAVPVLPSPYLGALE